MKMLSVEEIIKVINERISIAEEDYEKAYSDEERTRAFSAQHELEELLHVIEKSKSKGE